VKRRLGGGHLHGNRSDSLGCEEKKKKRKEGTEKNGVRFGQKMFQGKKKGEESWKAKPKDAGVGDVAKIGRGRTHRNCVDGSN